MHPKVFRWLVAGLGFFSAMLSCTDSETGTRDTASNEGRLLRADALLHRQLQAVYRADSVYAAQTRPAAQDSSTGKIIQAEMALRNTIDSLDKEPLVITESGETGRTLTSYFKAILRSRGTASDLRMTVSAENDDVTTAQQTVAQLQKQLKEKEQQIAQLEASKPKSGFTQPTPQELKNAQNSTYAPANGESPAQLRQRNKNLSLAYGDLQVKYFVLGRDYLVLKKQHERTVAELDALRKTGNP